MSDDFKALIGKVATGATLSRDESAAAFDRMMSGEARFRVVLTTGS